MLTTNAASAVEEQKAGKPACYTSDEQRKGKERKGKERKGSSLNEKRRTVTQTSKSNE